MAEECRAEWARNKCNPNCRKRCESGGCRIGFGEKQTWEYKDGRSRVDIKVKKLDRRPDQTGKQNLAWPVDGRTPGGGSVANCHTGAGRFTQGHQDYLKCPALPFVSLSKYRCCLRNLSWGGAVVNKRHVDAHRLFAAE